MTGMTGQARRFAQPTAPLYGRPECGVVAGAQKRGHAMPSWPNAVDSIERLTGGGG